jgi:hypothetical protein
MIRKGTIDGFGKRNKPLALDFIWDLELVVWNSCLPLAWYLKFDACDLLFLSEQYDLRAGGRFIRLKIAG